MLCWGVYRYRDSQYGNYKIANPSNKRYVICNPSADFSLMPTDLVYVLQQFNPNSSTKIPTASNESPKSTNNSRNNQYNDLYSIGEKKNFSAGNKVESSFKQFSRSSSSTNKRGLSSGSRPGSFHRKMISPPPFPYPPKVSFLRC
jgi:hypothetical protein